LDKKVADRLVIVDETFSRMAKKTDEFLWIRLSDASWFANVALIPTYV
jgi:hypothetical protein